MKKISISLCVASLLMVSSCDQLQQIGTEVLNSATTGGGLSVTEVANGLKQALEKGTGNAVSSLSKPGGYLNDALMKIAFPPEAKGVADKLTQLGMGSLITNFVGSLNKSAEGAAQEAKPIFWNAIKTMSFSDAMGILNGPENAATNYFKSRTMEQLTNAFTPKIKASLDRNNATKHWSTITSTYNKIPLVNKKVETDLSKYATEKALAGLFTKLSGEEKKIRENPAARTTELLKKVFGSVSN